jgi:holo-[acyl-carrier protein] synthase
MIAGVGVDIVKVNRFKNLRVPLNILGLHEQKEYERRGKPADYLATRFAAKEAFLKALGSGISPIANMDLVQLLNDDNGRPYFALHGWVYDFVKRNHYYPHVSVSDEEDVVAVFVTIEKRRR